MQDKTPHKDQTPSTSKREPQPGTSQSGVDPDLSAERSETSASPTGRSGEQVARKEGVLPDAAKGGDEDLARKGVRK